MNTLFPAILIGGPPHSGKSVMVYSITQALRERKVSHYALRACPDGEGDWANEIRQDFVRSLRIKGSFSQAFTETIITYLKKRHLPLLVDVGGKPKEAQKEIFSHCTHAILLIGDQPGAYGQNLAQWRQMMAEKGVPIIAEIKSTLTDGNQLTETEPMLIGRQQGLERGAFAAGPVFDALIEKIAALFSHYDEQQVAAIREALRPVDTQFVDLPKLAAELGNAERFWQPEDLLQLLELVPAQTAVSVYGRSPIWLYTALAMNAHPAPFASFDAKLGWVFPPTLPIRASTEADDWDVQLHKTERYSLLEMSSRSQYLDIDAPEKIPLINVSPNKGVILSGRLPIWLTCAVAKQLAKSVPWIAVFQPNHLNAGVVVYSKETAVSIGTLIQTS